MRLAPPKVPIVAAAAASLALAAPVSAGHKTTYDDSVRCAGKTVRNVQLETRSSEGAVFQKRKRTTSGVQAVTYACLLRSGSIERLDDPARAIHAFDAALAGRFVGYEREDFSDQFTVPSTLGVFDLKTGTRRIISATPNSSDRDTAVRAFVIKRNGSVAWLAVGDPSGDQAVFKLDATTDDPERLDFASGVARFDERALRLSADRRAVLWRMRGETTDRSAPLR
jgi:hypothetical protein